MLSSNLCHVIEVVERAHGPRANPRGNLDHCCKIGEEIETLEGWCKCLLDWIIRQGDFRVLKFSLELSIENSLTHNFEQAAPHDTRLPIFVIDKDIQEEPIIIDQLKSLLVLKQVDSG